MKKIISFVLIAVFLIALVVIEQVFLISSFDTLIFKLDNLNQQIVATETINTEDINNSILDIENYWQNIEKFLCLTINYNDLNQIGEQIMRVKAYIVQDQKDDCVAELEVLNFFSEKYQKIFKINFSNVF